MTKEKELTRAEIKEKMALIQKECGVSIFSYSLRLFKNYGYLSHPDDMVNIWFGVSKSIIEMLLKNIHEFNLKKFESEKADILAKIDKLKESIKGINATSDDMYV